MEEKEKSPEISDPFLILSLLHIDNPSSSSSSSCCSRCIQASHTRLNTQGNPCHSLFFSSSLLSLLSLSACLVFSIQVASRWKHLGPAAAAAQGQYSLSDSLWTQSPLRGENSKVISRKALMVKSISDSVCLFDFTERKTKSLRVLSPLV